MLQCFYLFYARFKANCNKMYSSRPRKLKEIFCNFHHCQILWDYFSKYCFFIYNMINPVFDNNYFVLMILAGIFLQSYWEGFQNVAFGMERMETTSYINVGMALILLLTYLGIDKSLITVKLVVGIYILNFFAKDCIYLFSLFKQKLIKGYYKHSKQQFNLLQKEMLVDSMPYYILNIFLWHPLSCQYYFLIIIVL